MTQLRKPPIGYSIGYKDNGYFWFTYNSQSDQTFEERDDAIDNAIEDMEERDRNE